MGVEAYDGFWVAIHDTATVHGMIEDYRAGLGPDRAADEVFWSLRDDLEQFYGDVLEVWRPWTTTVRGRGLDCGHHMAEEAPVELASLRRSWQPPDPLNRPP